MIYNCDENENDENSLNYDFTQWDSQQWWLILFCTGDIVHNVKNYNHELLILYKLSIQKIDHRHNENKMQKSY